MAKTEHTPEPWVLGDERTVVNLDGPDDVFIEIVAANYGMIALVDATPLDNPCIVGNAKLFVAAPALLAEHEKWARVIGAIIVDHLQNNHDFLDSIAQYCEIEMPHNCAPRLKSAAIAAAKGK